ncbi:helix-hairpin-helix domain-containing protein [uncultured Rhodoferax sp.]|uniref:ComEA family DNA-binding protein n=1 Tax=uncultured Rhodoferax sp. TaxID=223188 RepID=UPI0025EA6DBB|nr:helix-hairpin-helix domain-containing protein [uncultured Rhodoferax sp.]
MQRRARTLALLAVGLLWSLSSWALEVNSATEAQLDGLRGLGPSQTARILQAREAGPFKDWADFMARVKGIKAPTATKLSAQGLTVGGASYPGTAP